MDRHSFMAAASPLSRMSRKMMAVYQGFNSASTWMIVVQHAIARSRVRISSLL